MKRNWVVLSILAIVSSSAVAQASDIGVCNLAAKPAGCGIYSAPFPVSGVQPVSCKLTGYTASPVIAPVVLGSTYTPGAPSGSVQCAWLGLKPTAGLKTFTATATSADGQESAVSIPFTGTVTNGPPPAPTGFGLVP